MLLRAAIAFGVVFSVSLAAADTPPDLKKKNATELRDLGNKLFEEKNYLGALAVYKEAYERFPNVKILLNIGITLNKLERFADAANTFQRYLDHKDAEGAMKTELEKAIADLDKNVGVLELTITPADAQLQVNDGEWGAPMKLYRVPEGTYNVQVKKDGYQTENKSASIKAGEKLPIAITLAVLPEKTKEVIKFVPSGVSGEVTVEGPRSRIGAFAMEHLDLPHSGAATFVGVTFDVMDRLRIDGAAILGPNYGAYVGATLAVLTGKFRPIVAAGAPVFFSDGARYGLRGAGGLELQLSRHIALVAELGVEFMVNPEEDIKETLFIPAVGAMGRL